MQELVQFEQVNAVNSANVQIVSTFSTRVNQTTGEPFQMVLRVAIDKIKAETDYCEFPVYLPARNNYKEQEHLKMLEIFRTGAPWVPVICDNFKLYRQKQENHYHYFAFADSFKVIDYSMILGD